MAQCILDIAARPSLPLLRMAVTLGVRSVREKCLKWPNARTEKPMVRRELILQQLGSEHHSYVLDKLTPDRLRSREARKLEGSVALI